MSGSDYCYYCCPVHFTVGDPFQRLQSECPEKHKSFLEFKNAADVESRVILKQQLDDMARRFEKLSTRLQKLRSRLEFEEIKSRLLANLADVDARLATWRAKYSTEDNVTRLLAEYQVSTVI